MLTQRAARLTWLTLACQVLPSHAETSQADPLFRSDRQQYGYMNARAQVVLPAVYDEAGPFDAGGMARVKMQGKYGFIDRQGHWVVAPDLYNVGEFAPNGLAAAHGDQRSLTARLARILFSRTAWGFIDRKGKWVIEPVYLSTQAFGAGGVAPVRPQKSNSFGLMNASGAWVAAPTFAYIGEFGAHGLAPAQAEAAIGGSSLDRPAYGYINAAGKWMIAPAFGFVYPFAANGLARIIQGNKYGYIDLNGRWAVEPVYVSGGDFAANGLAAVEIANGSWTYIDARGKTAIAGPFIFAGRFMANGLATVRTAAGAGVIDTAGKWIMAPQFERIGGRSDDPANFGALGLMSVVDGGKDRVVNLQGQFMPEFDRYNEQVLADHARERARDRQLMAKNGVDMRMDGPYMRSSMALAVIWALCWYILMPLAVLALVCGVPLYLAFGRKKRKSATRT